MLKLVTAPAEEPLTLTEVKTHLRLSGSSEDTYLSSLIVAARQHAENYLNRALITQTWELYLDDFSDEMIIQKSPISAVSSVKYYDEDNTEQTLSTDYYDTDLVSEPARVTLAYNQTWPEVYDRTNGVVIRFVAGYGAAASVPSEIKFGMLLYANYIYDHRGDESIRPPRAIYDLWENHRVQWL